MDAQEYIAVWQVLLFGAGLGWLIAGMAPRPISGWFAPAGAVAFWVLAYGIQYLV
jgi:hypothetical protein